MDRLYYATFTIPANTPQVTPFNQIWPLEDNYLAYVDINVPPGNSGTCGFRVLWAQQQVIPWGNQSFLVTDNEKVHVDCDFLITVTGLMLQGFNTDIFPHTIYFRGLIQNLKSTGESQISPLAGSLAIPAGAADVSQFYGYDTMTGAPVGTLPSPDSYLTATSDESATGLPPEIPPETIPTEVTPIIPGEPVTVSHPPIHPVHPPIHPGPKPVKISRRIREYSLTKAR